MPVRKGNMKKEHSVNITLSSEETTTLLHLILKHKGLLNDIPNWVKPESFDDGEISLEYKWIALTSAIAIGWDIDHERPHRFGWIDWLCQ